MRIQTSILALLLSVYASAQSVAQKNKQCSGDLAVVNFGCANLGGKGDDVRLDVTEFQTCENGNITALDKSISGSVFQNPDEEGDTTVTLRLSGVRIHLDGWVNHPTVEVPAEAIIKTPNSTYTILMTSEIAPNYEGADIENDWHYKASYIKTNSAGKTVGSGALACGFQ